jgi:hypothetical protein
MASNGVMAGNSDYAYGPLGWTCQVLLNNPTQNLGYDVKAPVEHMLTAGDPAHMANPGGSQAARDAQDKANPLSSGGVVRTNAYPGMNEGDPRAVVVPEDNKPSETVTVAEQKAAGVAPEDTVTVAEQRAGTPAPGQPEVVQPEVTVVNASESTVVVEEEPAVVEQTPEPAQIQVV